MNIGDPRFRRRRRWHARLAYPILWLTVVVVITSCTSVSAVSLPAMVPTGLHPGDKYHLVFNSSRLTDATSSVVADYNAFVQRTADQSAISGLSDVLFRAIVSTPFVDARDNAPIEAPVYNMNLELVAAGFDDMWDVQSLDFLSASLAWDENGERNDEDAWTGTDLDGTAAPGLALGQGFVAWCGQPTLFMDNQWINFLTPSTSFSLHVYALSEELTVLPDSNALAADFDSNGQVEMNDFFVWQSGFGRLTGDALPSEGDTNGDGLVAGEDFLTWQQQFGSGVSDASSAFNVALPEPATLASLLALGCGLLLRERMASAA